MKQETTQKIENISISIVAWILIFWGSFGIAITGTEKLSELVNPEKELKLEITNITTTEQGIYIQGHAKPNTKIRVNIY